MQFPRRFVLPLAAYTLSVSPAVLLAQQPSFPGDAKRVVFLGDSITAAGEFIAMIETHLRQHGDSVPEIINLGLPSETCTGLSEPDHPFPRPNVHERLKRVLEKARPDLVVACYGMNDGIYHPFDVSRFEAYQKGIRALIDQVKATGAKLVLMTPPAFDPQPFRKQGKLLPKGTDKNYAWFAIYENYDDVIRRYAEWMKAELPHHVDLLVDWHTPVETHLAAMRRDDPDFALSPDGVHVDTAGHELLAGVLLQAWGYEPAELDDALLSAMNRKTALLHDAWLSHVGHKRPGMKPGLPLKEAQKQADAIVKGLEN